MAFFARFLKKFPAISPSTVETSKIHICVGVGAGCIFGGYVTLHTLLLDKYRDAVQLYKNGFESEITAEMNSKIQQVVNDLKLSEKYKGYLQCFYVPTLDPVHMGSFKLRGGAYVGIPQNFNYKSTGDIERDLITMKRKPVSWNSDGGHLFQDSLILSDNAQKFAIARELCHLNTGYVYNYALISCGALYVQYLSSVYLNIKTYGHQRPSSYRYTLYTLVGVFTFSLWAFVTDSLTKYYEKKADEGASSLGLNYARGGVELYTKVVRRNMAAREIMGADGEKLFTKYGNTNHELFRQRHIPVSLRKEQAEKRVQELLNKSEKKTENLEYS